MKIKGTVLKVYCDKGTWASISFEDEKGVRHKCAGTIISPAEGIGMELTGEFVDDPKWGKQFKVFSSKALIASEEQIVDYLSSSYIKGIGPVTARLIYQMFGPKSVDIVENHPEELIKVKGISEAKAKLAQETCRANRAYINLLEKLGGKATPHQIDTLYEKYGAKVFEVIENNPYVIIYDCDGFGFKRADSLAKASGISENDPRRVSAAITYTLKTMGAEGHCFCRIDSLEANLNELVENVPTDIIGDCIVDEIKNGHLVLEDDRLYTKDIYVAEDRCSEIICDMIKPRLDIPISMRDIDMAIKKMEYETGFELEKKQRDAITTACRSRFSIITGGPGTGKTTIIQGILKAIGNKYQVFLAAPTGKASRRMTEVTGKQATTIHRMLNNHMCDGANKPFFIVDEASMLDISLAHMILDTVYNCNGSICFIGDVDQLPPIGPGNFLRDLLSSSLVPRVKLELCHRQKGMIAINADRINQGMGTHSLNFSDPSFTLLEAKDSDKAQETMIEQYIEAIKEYPIQDVCCLSPMRKRSSTGTDLLNTLIRDRVNPLRPGMLTLEGFRHYDRVMETQNDAKRNIYNGDCGMIVSIDPLQKSMIVETDDGRRVEYGTRDLSTLVLAYAMTVHKSQGSEFKVAIIANLKEHFIMLQRNLLYTGVTRARDKVILIGTRQAIDISVRSAKAIQRNTFLKQKLIEKAIR